MWSLFFHIAAKKKKLNFNINDYPKFKDKIIYLTIDKEPEGLIKKENLELDSLSKRLNSLKRIEQSYNYMSKGIEQASEDDLIMLSDNDEIPNLSDFDFKKIHNNFIIFEQLFFYYKFNLLYDRMMWFGTKACKKKKLISPQWLRNIKNKKYSLLRLDTFFSRNKYINKLFIKNGGWHFSNIKNAEGLELKLKSYLHHRDYEAEELGYNKIDKLIKNNETIYDMFGDKKSKKYGDEKRKKLAIYDLKKLPSFIQDNVGILKEWMD